MTVLSALIWQNMDSLARDYDQELSKIGSYQPMPAVQRREAARKMLNLMAAWMESDSDEQALAALQSIISQRIKDDYKAGDLLVSLGALEKILMTQAEDLENAKFLSGMMAKARDVVILAATEVLRESEQRLRQLINRSPVGMYRTTPAGKIVDANPAFFQITGYDSMDALNAVGVPALYANPEDRKRLIELLKKEPVIDFETIFVRPEGEKRHVSLSARIDLDEKGEIAFLEGIVEDITPRKQTEVALQESQDFYQTIFNSTPVMFWVKDTQNRMLQINRAAANLEGVDPKDMAGRSSYDVYPKEQADAFYADDLTVINSGQPKTGILEQHTSPGTGETMWIETGKIPIRNAEGEITGVLAFAVDVTKSKQADQAIRASQQRLSLLVEQSPLAVIEWNTNFEVVSWNPAAERIFGYSTEESIGHHAAGLIVPAEVRPIVDKVWQDLLTQTGGTRSTNENITKDGRTITCEWHNTPLIDADGKTIGVSSIVEDITERKKLEQAVQESLERRSHQVEVSTQVAQEITAAHALDELFARVVTLIKERFGYYHAQIFRFDRINDAVVLVQGYGEAGQKMLAAGHKLQMGHGVVGTAAQDSKTILASDVTLDQDWHPNPNLPETKGELAVPIKFRDEMLGILDVQSDKAGVLSLEDQTLLEGLCGQIAIAIENTRATERIRVSQARLEAIFDNSGVAISVVNLEGRYTQVNEKFASLLRYEMDEIYTVTNVDITHPDDAAESRNKLQELIRGENNGYRLEKRFVRKDGDIFWGDLSVTPIRNEAGKIEAIVGMVVDINERKHAEIEAERLRHEIETELRIKDRALASSANAVLIASLDGKITYVNDAFLKTFGYTREESLSLNSNDISQNPDEDQRVINKAVRTQGYFIGESVARRKDGTSFPVDLSISMINDTNGQPMAAISSYIDATERKQAEEALRTSEERFRSIYENTTIGMYRTTPGGKILMVNPALLKMLGYESFEELAQRDLETEGYEEGYERKQYRERVESGRVQGDESAWSRKDGSAVYVLESATAIRDADGNVLYYEGTVEDISERKKAEEAIRESQQKLSLLIETSPLAIIEWNTKFEVVSWNPAAERIFGYPAAEAAGHHAAGLIVPAEVRPIVDKVWQDLLTQTGGTRSTNDNITKSGQAITCEWFNTPLIGADGKVIGVSSLVEDITERVNLEREIQESLEHRGYQVEVTRQVAQEISATPDLETLFPLVVKLIKERFDYYHVQIFRYDPDEDIITMVSGYGEAGKNMLEASHKLSMGRGVVGTAAQTGTAILASDITEDKDWRPNPNLPDTKGELAVPIKFRDEILGILDVQSDKVDALTQDDLLLIESLAGQIATAIENARVLEEASTFRQGIEQSDQAMFVTKLDGTITYVNAAFERIYGFTPSEVIGKTPRIIKSERATQEYYNGFWKSLLNKQTVTGEIINRTKAGRLINVESSTSPILNPKGQLLGFLAVHRDVTQRKQSELETQETLRELERLYQSMSQSGWATYQTEMQASSSYVYDNIKVEEKNIWTPEVALAIENKAITRAAENNQATVAPLSVRGEIIGALGVKSDQRLSDEDLAMLESISEQVALALESARLFGQTQQALGQANTFKQLVNATTQGIGMSNLQSQLVYANEALVKIFGEETALDIVGKELLQFYPDHLRDYFANEVLETVMQKDSWTGEINISPKTGKEIPTINNVFLVKDDNGTPQFVANVITDITERKLSEESLRRQNEYLATATEVGRLITSTLDLPTLFERTVNLIQSRFGYYHVAIFSVDESGFSATLREGTGEAGRIMKEQKHSITVGAKSVLGNVTANGTTLVVNNTAIDLLHRVNPLLLETRAEAGIPLKIGARVIGALDIQAKDINAFHQDDIAVLEILSDQIAVAIDNAFSYELAQTAADELREADRIKSQFLANMSHELRTPLNSIIGFSRVILKGIDGPVTEQQHQDLSAIYNSGQHLLGLINDILDLSKIEAGKMELAIEEMNIIDTVNSVMSTAIGLLKDKPVKLKQEIEPNLPTIRADPMRLRQVLLNLISNASKFTEEGSITVTANLHTSSTGQREILVSVTDTGPGVSPEDQNKLFLAFSQVDSSPTRKSGGTGLGLSICQRLIDMHGGKIGVHSVVGKGSTFYFTVPTYQQPSTESSSEGKVILCIDDDPQVISLYERYLKPAGFQVVSITNPVNAKDSIKRLKPYAVTLDIMMPGVDGWQVLEELKADPDTRNTPIIICSIVEEGEKGFSLGAADYLVKPISEEDLIAALSRFSGDGSIREILVIDDSPDDLRLMGKIVTEHSQLRAILAGSGEEGWEILITEHPQAVILDLFMPGIDGFAILERMRTTPELRDTPVIVVSGMDLTAEQKKQLDNLGQQLLQKGMLNEKELFTTLEKALKRLETKGKQG